MTGLAVTFALASLMAAGALVFRWRAVRGLGTQYIGRFWVVQGLFINAALLAVWQWTSQTSGLIAEVSAVWLNLAYVFVFFFYSIANIDWTIKKFHAAES